MSKIYHNYKYIFNCRFNTFLYINDLFKKSDFGNLPKNSFPSEVCHFNGNKMYARFFCFLRDYRFIRYTKITTCQENMYITIQIKPQIYANTKMANISKMLFMVAIIIIPIFEWGWLLFGFEPLQNYKISSD